MGPVSRPEAESGPALPMEGEPAPLTPPGLNKQASDDQSPTHCDLPHHVHNKSLTSLHLVTGNTFGVR